MRSFSGVCSIAFGGDRQALRRLVASGRAIAATRGSGAMVRAAFAAQTPNSPLTARESQIASMAAVG